MKQQKADIDATHQELHRVPLHFMAVPAHIHVVGYLDDPGASSKGRDHFRSVAAAIGVTPADIHIQETRAFATRADETGRVLLKLDTAPGHYTIQTWWISDEGPTFGRLPIYPADLEFPARNKLTELDIRWLDSLLTEEEIVADFEPGTDILSSAVCGGKLQVATNYEPDSEGRERYLVFPLKEQVVIGQVEFVVDSIVRIENHFHLLYLPQSNYQTAARKLAEIETAATAEMHRLDESLPTATTETLKQALHNLSASFTQLASLSDESQRHFSDAINYKEVLRTAFKTWREQPLDNYLPLSAPILRSSAAISGDYGQLLARVERVRKQKADMINILRTKIELLERDQSLALQRSQDETTKSQMAMQMTIEGLYVFIVAFYLTELARIVFEALREAGLISASPYLLAAFFIPFAIAAGLVLSGKAGQWLERRRTD